MEIKVTQEDMGAYDSGGGCREVIANIVIDEKLHPRMKRVAVVYEVLGSCLGYMLSHESLDDITNAVVEGLDQLDPV